MRIKSVQIHNFRSIKDGNFDLMDYAVILGANNAGKSNIITALRIFYEDKIKFNKKLDFPKFKTDDNESWIELEFLLPDEDFSNLKDEYKCPNNTLRVRKYFDSDNFDVNSNQSNIYAYEDGNLSENLFYGAKNISQAKLGNVIYIPDVAKIDDTLKLSGPSPLRDIIKFVMAKVVKTSDSFERLNDSFQEFNTDFREERSKDGFSLNEFTEKINNDLDEWDIQFKLDINPINPDSIIKNLVSYNIDDNNLKKAISVKNMGQGVQRHLIYTLLKLSSQYNSKKLPKKKEFSPDFTLILFEEPEAFLHSQQQESLNSSLKEMSYEDMQQILVTTHSSVFISKNIEEINSLVRLKRQLGVTNVHQVSEETKKFIIEQNSEMLHFLKDKHDDKSLDDSLRNAIKQKFLDGIDPNKQIEEESMRYILWLDNERCCAFFADNVLICEGATEKVLIDYLIKNKWQYLSKKRIYVLDALGKFNVHRYMNLFNELGILHSVLIDDDENEGIHSLINQFIKNQANGFTKEIDFFDKDIESFLNIPTPKRRDRKPLNAIWHYNKNKISEEKIKDLETKVNNLL
jgi:putative ATP-dependent endonuclease of the OLD family